MERLTTNKPVDEMSMVELAYNSCYAEDRLARYRDFEMDTDARDFARNLMTTLTDDELSLDDENFDEEILENLQYDPFSDIRGLIALFYRNLWAMAELRERLKAYEDAEEQGLLLRLPCKVGDKVYLTEHNRLVFRDRPLMCIVDEFSISGISGTDCCSILNANEPFYALHRFKAVNIKDFGKTVFLTKEEAEQALKQEGENERI